MSEMTTKPENSENTAMEENALPQENTASEETALPEEPVLPEEAVPPETEEEPPEEPYWGSVLFCKRLILSSMLLMILIAAVLAGIFGAKLSTAHKQIQELSSLLDDTALADSIVSGVIPARPSDPLKLMTAVASQTQEKKETYIEPELPAYTALYPALYADPAEYGTEDIDRSVYLTFDDGPSSQTDRVLEILDEYGVKATFFVVGASSEADLQRMRNIVEAGHTIGIHSFTHEYRDIYASVEDYLNDFNAIYNQIVEATGVKPQIFRFPGGSINGYNGAIYQELIAEMTRRGFVYFDWNVTVGDASTARQQSAATLIANALKGVGTTRRAIALMHDGSGKTTTVEALPDIIEGYLAGGYTFAALTAETKQVIFGYGQ